MTELNQTKLEAYLDDALPAEEMARIERAVREEPRLAEQVAEIQRRRNAGLHSLGDIWRRRRLSCPTRDQLRDLKAGRLPTELADYVRFHIEVIGCAWCQANWADIERQSSETEDAAHARRRRYFQSSAGLLRRNK